MADNIKAVLFRLDSRSYALHLDNVERIIRAVEITPLPKAPEIVLGIINLHGEIVPVVDIRKRFSLPSKEISLSDQIIILRTLSRKIAFICDSAEGYKEIPSEDIVRENRIWNGIEYVEGVVSLAGEMVLINNLNKFLLLEEELQTDKALQSIKNKEENV